MANSELTSNTASTLSGYFSSQESAESAVRKLREAGFTRSQISLAGTPEGGWNSSDTIASGSPVDDSNRVEGQAYHEGHKAGEAVGGFWQRIKNLFEGDEPEAYADESARGELATHEIVDYEPNDFHQSWGGAELPENRSRYFSSRWERTGQGVLVKVTTSHDRRAEAEAILEANGADLGDSRSDDTTQRNDTEDAALAAAADIPGETRVANPRRIQLYGEVLRVHRERVASGEVRLRKETVTENQSVEVPVTREELVLERVPVTGEQTVPGARIGEETEVRVPLSQERVSIEKEPVVREQVEVGKREVTNVESREEPVRHEELRVEEQDRLRKAS